MKRSLPRADWTCKDNEFTFFHNRSLGLPNTEATASPGTGDQGP